MKFVAKPEDELLMAPTQDGNTMKYPIPVDDFAFSMHRLAAEPTQLAQDSAAIIFCLSGRADIRRGDELIQLKPGESCFVAAAESPVTVQGEGHIARVYNRSL